MSATDTPLPGRIAVITGANSGLGLCSARALAEMGATVVLACRNPERARTAQDQVAARATGDAPQTLALDLADLSSVAAAADELRDRFGHIDILMNNAGIMAPPRAKTAQGFELQFGVNHLGHFAFTGRLLPMLLAAPTPRVVTVASGAHRAGWMHWDDLDAEKSYFSWTRYGQSKLANLLFSGELARQAQDHQTTLVSVAAHPGYAATNLNHNGPGARGANRFMDAATKITDRFVGQPEEQGALPQIHAATAPDVGNDDYFGPDGFMEQRGKGVHKVGRTSRAKSREDAARLWRISEERTGVTFAWGA